MLILSCSFESVFLKKKLLDKSFIPRCYQCSLIPSLSLVIENNNHKIEYEYDNRYKGALSFDKFIKE